MKNEVKILLFRQNILMVEGKGSSRCLGDYSKSWIQILSGDIENLSTNQMTELGIRLIIRFIDISRISYITSRPTPESSSKELNLGCILNLTWTLPDLSLTASPLPYPV